MTLVLVSMYISTVRMLSADEAGIKIKRRIHLNKKWIAPTLTLNDLMLM